MTIRKIDVELTERVETGPVQFGEDWPGVFIRGDNAAYYALMLKAHLDGDETTFGVSEAACRDLLRLLQGCRV